MSRRKAGSARIVITSIIFLTIAALALVGIWYFGQNGTKPQNARSGAPEQLAGVGPDGTDGDPILNRLKNRATAPATVKDYNVDQIIAIPNDILEQEGRRQRSNWYPAARLHAQQYESLGARVTGYIVKAKQSGLESANGYVDSLRDYHIWISETPEGSRARSLIVEMTPRWKAIHPEWRLRYLQSLVENRAKVRVTGWLLWDEEHASEVDKSRGTQWEIHPVTLFEVWSNGRWEDLKGNDAAEDIELP